MLEQRERINQALILFSQLEQNSGKLDKLAILRKGQGNPVFRDLLYRTYNPFLVYNMKKIPEVINYATQPMEINYEHFTHLLEDLNSRSITGNDAKWSVEKFMTQCTEDEAKWYTRIIKKDLNIGIQAKTINEVFPKLIPTFSPMLAEPYEKKRTPKQFILQPKLDGMRILGDTTTGKLYSRKGKEVEGFTDLEEAIRQLPDGYFIDGEIMTGTFNNLMTQAFRKETGKVAFLNTFDLVPQKDFFEGHFDQDVLGRTTAVASLVESAERPELVIIESSPILRSFDEAEPYYERYLEQGFEGAMMKDVNAGYVNKRSYAWMKLKPTETYDIPVIAVEEGKDDTKYVGSLGKLVCMFNGNEVRVGSGLTDLQRQLWWNNPQAIIGKTIEVEAQETTENQKGTTSLRFPRFKRVREDK